MRIWIFFLCAISSITALANEKLVDQETSLRRVCNEGGLQVYHDRELTEPMMQIEDGEVIRFFNRIDHERQKDLGCDQVEKLVTHRIKADRYAMWNIPFSRSARRLI